MIEWPKGEKEPTKYWLSTLPAKIGFPAMVRMAKLRWRIEHDYQELKQEIGLGHFEGRGWRGFHHHATLCIAAYGFLICERQAIPLSEPRRATQRQTPSVPRSPRSGPSAAANRTSRPQLDRHDAAKAERRHRSSPTKMPMLRSAVQTDALGVQFMTQ